MSLPRPERFEPERENVAIRRRELVAQGDHRSEERLRRIRLRSPITRDLHHHQRAPQSIDHERRNKATAIAAHVNDQPFLANLREVLLGKLVQARLAHVGNMNITDFAVGLLADLIDVFLHPCAIIERRFIRDRDYRDVSGAIVCRLRVNPQDHLFVGGADQGIVDVGERTNWHPVNRQDVIARLHVQSNRGQRRAGVFVPVFARQNLFDLIGFRSWIAR